MANSRVRFITEVAPPQFVSTMRYRATKMLDTINEEERGCSANDSLAFALAPKSTLSSLSSAAASSNATNRKHFLKEIQITLSVFGNLVNTACLDTQGLIWRQLGRSGGRGGDGGASKISLIWWHVQTRTSHFIASAFHSDPPSYKSYVNSRDDERKKEETAMLSFT
ncbi:hypothetical protein RJ639_028630 [Escallonia herrerae]|uniref:Uncharacterized protein n=1 Tax=Escallonia herrerae TaxID=1293975 RepID=A0AA88X6X9_9ASTE|nr:hypothetical protein RJ639_028630 [Escallonia herrerae]